VSNPGNPFAGPPATSPVKRVETSQPDIAARTTSLVELVETSQPDIADRTTSNQVRPGEFGRMNTTQGQTRP
jgi:hypothetical protein